MNEFNPRIEVHNGEGLTITVRPDREKFVTTDLKENEIELKFNDEDIDSNNEVKWKNNSVGRQELIEQVFLGQRPPNITYPLDGSMWNDSIVRWDLSIDEKWKDTSTLVLEISKNNNFTNDVTKQTLELSTNSHTLNLDNLLVKYFDSEIYLRIILLMSNGVKMTSQTVRCFCLTGFYVDFINPINNGILTLSPIRVECNLDKNVLSKSDMVFEILDTMYNYSDSFHEEFEIPVKEITTSLGFGKRVSIKVTVTYSNIITLEKTIECNLIYGNPMYTIVELVDYLNNNGEVWLADTSKLRDLSYFWCMLNNDTRSRDLSDMKYWKTSSITNMSWAFSVSYTSNTPHGRKSYIYNPNGNDGWIKVNDFHYDISNWDVSRVTNMSHMFSHNDGTYTNDSSIDLNNWDTSSVLDMSFMFYSSSGVSLNISNWNTSSVGDMSCMFKYTTHLASDISNWDVSSVTSMEGTFMGRMSMSKLSLRYWNVSNVLNMNDMFNYNISIWNDNISSWDTSKVQSMDRMFMNAEMFNNNISMWNVMNVYSWNNIFDNCPISHYNKPQKFR